MNVKLDEKLTQIEEIGGQMHIQIREKAIVSDPLNSTGAIIYR